MDFLETEETGLSLVDLGIISPNDVLYHKDLIVRLLGEKFWDEFITRIVETTIYNWHDSEFLFDDCIAYLIARSKMDDPSDDLVANLLPDQAWHAFLQFTAEYGQLCYYLAGQFLHHDPAGERTLVSEPSATMKTIGLFEQHGIGYHPRLWQDHILFAGGANFVKTGVWPRVAVAAVAAA